VIAYAEHPYVRAQITHKTESKPAEKIVYDVDIVPCYAVKKATEIKSAVDRTPFHNKWLEKNLERVQIGLIEDGTSVGSAITASLNRLKDTQAKSKIIILLTDGINNTGKISPEVAAEAAKAPGVKIYTIGAGSKGPVPYPAMDFFGRTVYQRVQIEIDEEVLKKIAQTTEAKYFRATDTRELQEIYKEIDALEKVPMEEEGFHEYKELFPLFLLPSQEPSNRLQGALFPAVQQQFLSHSGILLSPHNL